MQRKNSSLKQFQIVLEKDIETFQEMKLNKHESSDFSRFLNTLIKVKKRMLELLSEILERNNLSFVRLKKLTPQIHKPPKKRIDLQSLLPIFYQIEKDQQRYIKNDFIPSSEKEVECKKSLLELYDKLIEQIESL